MMHSANPPQQQISRQLSSNNHSTASQTDDNPGAGRPGPRRQHSVATPSAATQSQQQQPNAAGGWRVLVDIPMTRELIQGPLNIQIPPIQLPSGLTTLMGQLRSNSSSSNTNGNANITNVANQQDGNEQQSAQQSIPQSPIVEQQENLYESFQDNMSSPTSTIVSWSRAASTPAVLNSSLGGSSSSTSDSFVIDMRGEETPGGKNKQNHVYRRRSSSPLRPSSNPTGVGGPRRQLTTANGMPQQHSQFSPLAEEFRRFTQRNFTNNWGTSPGSGGSANRTTSTVDLSLNTTANGDDSRRTTNNNGANGGGGDESAQQNLNNLRARMQELLRRRHQILQSIVNQTGEFPGIYCLAWVACFLLVTVVVLFEFLAIEFAACLSLMLSFFHYSDLLAFKRCLSGTGSAWLLIAKIVARELIMLELLGQHVYVFPTAIFQVISVQDVPEQTFWSIIYALLLTQCFIMDCVLILKIVISKLPKCSTTYKRALYQWLEYTSTMYRFAVPFVQWNAYFDAMWWTVLYGGVKILLGLGMAWGWLLITIRMFHTSHLGNAASEEECRKQHEQCTICFDKFVAPIKLKCSHIFCAECIRTWLDREHTCPICRTIITKDDNNYRNGESLLPSLF